MKVIYSSLSFSYTTLWGLAGTSSDRFCQFHDDGHLSAQSIIMLASNYRIRHPWRFLSTHVWRIRSCYQLLKLAKLVWNRRRALILCAYNVRLNVFYSFVKLRSWVYYNGRWFARRLHHHLIFCAIWIRMGEDTRSSWILSSSWICALPTSWIANPKSHWVWWWTVVGKLMSNWRLLRLDLF
jgi:hypothetical protein